MRQLLNACVLLFLPALSPVVAQKTAVPRFCIMHRPECTATAVTETLIGIQNNGDLTALTIGFEGGLMHNITNGAFGMSAYWAYQSHGHRWGIKPRFRRWVNETLSLDLSAGLILNSGEDRFEPTYPGYVLQANLAVDGINGAMVRLEFLRTNGESTRDLTLGVQLGARTGATGGLILLILGALANLDADRVYVR